MKNNEKDPHKIKQNPQKTFRSRSLHILELLSLT